MLANTDRHGYARLMTICFIDSPVGRLALEADDDTLTGVRWAGPSERAPDAKPTPVLKEATRQLERYFARKLQRFDLPLAAHGTDFQKRVWQALRRIPHGSTISYGEQARLANLKPE